MSMYWNVKHVEIPWIPEYVKYVKCVKYVERVLYLQICGLWQICAKYVPNMYQYDRYVLVPCTEIRHLRFGDGYLVRV